MGHWTHEPGKCEYISAWGKVTFFMCAECISKWYGKEEVIEKMSKVKVEVTLEEFKAIDQSNNKRMVQKALSFVCAPDIAEKVFRAACDAAREEEENGKKEKVGGTE